MEHKILEHWERSQMIHEAQTAYIHDKTGRVHVETINVEPSKTEQQFKDECDINNIIKKYDQTGFLTHINKSPGIYADFTQLTDLTGMIETVTRAQTAFDMLDAKIRYRFGNDPQQLVNFLSDSTNYEEALAMGLVNKRDENANANNANLNAKKANAKTTTKKTVPGPSSNNSDDSVVE